MHKKRHQQIRRHLPWLRRAWLCLFALKICAMSVVANELVQQSEVPKFKKPVVIKFEGPIDWNHSTYFHNRVHRAKKMGADLLIVEINSPGGLVSESLRMAETLRDIDWAYTVAYVPSEAISGAALFSLGCDEILLNENAIFGDIGAIEFDPQLFAYRYVPAKAQSQLVTKARSIAKSKGHSPDFAEAMIDKNVLLFAGKEENKGQFKTTRLKEKQSPEEAIKQANIDESKWELISESGVERFLTLDGKRLLEIGVTSTTVNDKTEMLEHLNAEPVAVTMQYNTTDAVVNILNSPLVTIILVIVGIIALYIELSAPGIGAGGMIAFLCAAIFFWSRFMGGTSGVLEIVLFVCGIIFLLMEVFVIPGWGISGFLGLALILGSAVLAGMDFVIPESSAQWNRLITNVLLILCSSVAGVIALSWLAHRMGSIPILNRIMLDPKANQVVAPKTEKGKDGKPGRPVHPLVSVGDWGTAESVLRPAGRARFGNRSIDVVSEGSFIDPGDQVKVVEINGNRIVVAPIENLGDTVARPEQA